MKIVCLGNEFIEKDCFAKEVGILLKKDFDVVNIKNSFELMGMISNENDFILLDVVEGLNEVRGINVEDLRVDSILSAHDFDVGQVLRLLDVSPRIIGIPMTGVVEDIAKEVGKMIACKPE